LNGTRHYSCFRQKAPYRTSSMLQRAWPRGRKKPFSIFVHYRMKRKRRHRFPR
jgi:hypothetical protein